MLDINIVLRRRAPQEPEFRWALMGSAADRDPGSNINRRASESPG